MIFSFPVPPEIVAVAVVVPSCSNFLLETLTLNSFAKYLTDILPLFCSSPLSPVYVTVTFKFPLQLDVTPDFNSMRGINPWAVISLYVKHLLFPPLSSHFLIVYCNLSPLLLTNFAVVCLKPVFSSTMLPGKLNVGSSYFFTFTSIVPLTLESYVDVTVTVPSQSFFTALATIVTILLPLAVKHLVLLLLTDIPYISDGTSFFPRESSITLLSSPT